MQERGVVAAAALAETQTEVVKLELISKLLKERQSLIPGVEPVNIRQILLNLATLKDPATLRVEPFFAYC